MIPTGIHIVNVTAHPIKFAHDDNQSQFTIVAPCGLVVRAIAQENLIEGIDGIEFVRTEFVPDDDENRELGRVLRIERNGNIGKRIVFVGSILAAQAYPGLVHGMVPCTGTEKAAPDLKVMRSDKFIRF